MTIINTQIKGGGITPSGTLNIGNNGVFNVTNYANADVQVPVPVIYREFEVNAYDTVVPKANLINFSTGKMLSQYTLAYGYYNLTFPSNTTIDFSKLTYLYSNAMNSCFYLTKGIVSVDLSGLTGVDTYGLYSCFTQSEVTSIDLRNVAKLTVASPLASLASNCYSLTNVNLDSLYMSAGNSSTNKMFFNCTSLNQSHILKSLVSTTGTGCCTSLFQGCTALTSCVFDSLKLITGASSFATGFSGCTSLTSLYFPAVNNSSFGTQKNQFTNLLSNVTGCTIYFPKNLDPQSGSTALSALTGYPSFSGTNTVLSFTLPSTNLLNGADSKVYERNPKDDTATALAWRVQDIGSGTSLVVNWTSYYTNGLTDPAVNGTIYSDSACTTAVTTISSITQM